MHWIAFSILLYLVTVLQTTATPFIAVHTIQPDFLVILAVHYALMARTQDALLACWLIGLMKDLCGMSYSAAGYANVGVSAFTLGLIAIVIVNVRDLTFRENASTQLMFTLLAKLVLALLVGFHMLYALNAWHRTGEIMTVAAWQAVYTAILAPYGHWLLRRLRRPLGLGVTQQLRVR